MRKIYSLVLMTAMLLVGTNVWGVSVSSGADLKTQMESANNTGNTVNIELAGEITLTSVVQICSHISNSVKPTVNLDLKGHTLTVNVTTKENDSYRPFQLYRGTLNILSTDGEGKIISNNDNTDLIAVFGYKNDTTEWSKLEIAANVSIIANGSKANAIVLDGFTSPMKHAYVNVFGTKDGVECDVENYVYPELVNTTNAHDKAYDMWIYSGLTGDTQKKISQKNYYPLIEYSKVGYTTERPRYYESALVGYVQHGDNRYPVYGNGGLGSGHHSSVYGANVVINGYVYGAAYGVKVNGTVTDKEGNIPNVTISSSAEVACLPTATSSTAIYASGYANWTIQGYVHGSTGIYVKGGSVTIDGAIVESENETLVPTEGTASGIKSGGSAIVIESNTNYPGGQNVTITNDATITGGGGYGICETVTVGGKDTIESVVISGATIEGGTAGAIAIVASDKSQTIVYSGNIEGEITDENGDPTTVSLFDLIPDDTHTTPIYGTDGKKIGDVVSAGVAPAGNDSIKDVYNAWNPESGNPAPSITWTGDSETINKDVKLTLLEICKVNGSKIPQPQNLTIQEGKTLEVEKVVLGKAAVITVEAGARLIVTGSEGIYSLEKTNIVLKANAGNQATFIIGPNVSSNRQPFATVEYTPTTYMMANGTKVWQRFTSPLDKVSEAPTNNASSLGTIDYVTGSTLLTYASYYDGATGWVNLTKWAQLRSFRASAIANNTPLNTNVTYTFKGKLAGNVTDSIAFWNPGWNYYGNSYIAPMSTKSLISALAAARTAGIDVDGTLYMWNVNDQKYMPLNTTSTLFGGGDVEVPALQCFVIKLRSGNFADFDINYGNTVYDYAIHPENYSFSAPARLNSGTSTVRINIESANGMKDAICIVENDTYSADYDESADAEKLMEGDLNLYVAEENMNLSMLASDDILGSLLTLQTADEINYTLSFDYVRGEVYALRDNQTNAVVLMNEGATYNFTAQPNATLDGRFQIVSRQERPTAVETIEETVAPKAIYTIMGQYVGETTDWNNLPAGVYVVDGVKVIK